MFNRTNQGLAVVPEPRLTSPANARAVSIHRAKAHLGIPEVDVAQDEEVFSKLDQATAQVEHDTGMVFIQRQYRLDLEELQELQFSVRPVTKIDSVSYIDSAGTRQMLAEAVYALDESTNSLRLRYNQSFPTQQLGWENVQITFTAGFGTDYTKTPKDAERAILLLLGYNFENRDGLVNEVIFNQAAYDKLVRRMWRSTYP